jgi:hypothetical protein
MNKKIIYIILSLVFVLAIISIPIFRHIENGVKDKDKQTIIISGLVSGYSYEKDGYGNVIETEFFMNDGTTYWVYGSFYFNDAEDIVTMTLTKEGGWVYNVVKINAIDLCPIT